MIMKKLKNYWMIAVMAVLGTWCLTSCSDDDGGGGGGRDFIEVTFDGKTYKKDMFGIYATTLVDNDLMLSYSTEDVFDNKGFSFFYGITMPEGEPDILDSSTGTYRAVRDFKGSSVRSFDFTADLEFYDKDEYFYVESGTHKVTSIRKVDGGVEIEGTFDVVMEENYTYETKKVKGKYRMTTEAYYSYE